MVNLAIQYLAYLLNGYFVSKVFDIIAGPYYGSKVSVLSSDDYFRCKVFSIIVG